MSRESRSTRGYVASLSGYAAAFMRAVRGYWDTVYGESAGTHIVINDPPSFASIVAYENMDFVVTKEADNFKLS